MKFIVSYQLVGIKRTTHKKEHTYYQFRPVHMHGLFQPMFGNHSASPLLSEEVSSSSAVSLERAVDWYVLKILFQML